MKKVLVIVLCILLGYYVFFAKETLSFTALESIWHSLVSYYKDYPYRFATIYFLTYVLFSALPTPGMMGLSLLGGSIMGFEKALLLVSFSSTIGSTLAMLSSRYLFRGYFMQRFPVAYKKVQQGFERSGKYYVFMLRLIPVPYFLVNILLGLTPVSIGAFYVVSQIGMLPTTALVIKTGAELGLAGNLGEIFTYKIMLLFVALGIFPLLMKKIFQYFMPQEGTSL